MPMRIQLEVSVMIMMLVFGCDEPNTARERNTIASLPSDAAHPYLSCVEGEIDPVCEVGCGDEGSELDAHAVCGIPCSDASTCEAYAGPSVAACVTGRCYYFCESDADCPSGLECVERGDPLPNDPYAEFDECKAPGSP